MPRYPAAPPGKSSAEAGGVAAVDRALMVLAAFGNDDRALSLPEIARRTDLVKSTALRLLASLIHFDLVQKVEDGRYVLGPEVARLNSVYTSTFSLEGVVMPVLRGLVERTKESAAFHVIQGGRRVVLHRVDSPQPIRYQVAVGEVMPLDRGAGGRVLSAFSGAKGALYEKIRKEGVASLVGDRYPDLAGISAPVFKAGGALVGAVTLTMPANRFRKDQVGPVKRAAREVSGKLGYF